MPKHAATSTFLLDTADGKHPAAQGDLASHGHVFSHRAALSTEARAVAMVTPAEGPSLGMAPAGICM